MTYEKENLKHFENETQTNINELETQIREIENQFNNINLDYLKAICISLELLDPKGLYFEDDINSLKQVIRVLNVWEFNRCDYIISKLENEYK